MCFVIIITPCLFLLRLFEGIVWRLAEPCHFGVQQATAPSLIVRHRKHKNTSIDKKDDQRRTRTEHQCLRVRMSRKKDFHALPLLSAC